MKEKKLQYLSSWGDHFDPHRVVVDIFAGGCRPLLAESPDVEMLVFYRHPLRFETLCHIAGAVVQQKPGNCLKFSNFLGFICRIYEILEPKLVSFLLFWQNVPSDP